MCACVRAYVRARARARARVCVCVCVCVCVFCLLLLLLLFWAEVLFCFVCFIFVVFHARSPPIHWALKTVFLPSICKVFPSVIFLKKSGGRGRGEGALPINIDINKDIHYF